MTGRILFVAANPSVDRLYALERLTVGAVTFRVTMEPVPLAPGAPMKYSAATTLPLPLDASLAVPPRVTATDPFDGFGASVRALVVGPVVSTVKVVEPREPQLLSASRPRM